MRWKYIVLQMSYKAGEQLGNGSRAPRDLVQEIPVIFPEYLVHREVASVGRLPGVRRNFDDVVSAGFCYNADGEWVCQGRSESLNLDSRSSDSDLLNNYERTRGIL